MTDPSVSISGPSDPSNDAAPSFTVTVSDDYQDGSTSCTLDGDAVDCTGGATVSQGQHTFTATATDAAGNSDSASHSWYADLTAPTVSIDSSAVSDPTNDANPSFDVSSSDDYGLDSTTCDLDGAAFDCAGGSVSEGAHTFTATATEQAGNSASASISW